MNARGEQLTTAQILIRVACDLKLRGLKLGSVPHCGGMISHSGSVDGEIMHQDLKDAHLSGLQTRQQHVLSLLTNLGSEPG